jgi:multicomponent Na+:H+ antiporter subunit G
MTRDVATTVLLYAGVALMVVACLGVLFMRDVFERLHYQTPAALGALLVGIAILVRESFSLIGNKALFVGVFLVASGTVLVHVTGRMARVRELGDWRLQGDEEVEEAEE